MSLLYNFPFEANEIYHVYNKAVGKEKLFYGEDNYRFFLQKFSQYLSDSAHVYTYCLIPNHFHFLIRVAPTSSPNLISEKFRRFLISYSKSINKQQERSGSLFNKHLKRVKIDHMEQLIWIVYYIHRNPLHHGITKDFKTYKWSSFKALVSNKYTELKRQELYEWFDGKKHFLQFHEENQVLDLERFSHLFLE
ncbi:transposase [Rhodohalobacter sp. SW132]|uniref:transposase n=1 Tax=Rhodohalobacter sp. SW132 TaxID=2293433 RepID=UPI0011C0623F|nr:transposase [Rhodohalobacter sp. SW132]